MRMSDSIAELACALSKAQGAIEDATKTGINPAFRSKYADLAAVRAVIREPLAVNDLSIVQFPRTVDGAVEVETMLIHKSGEYLAETLRIPVAKWDAHGIGSGITYSRRYGLMSILALASDDDDGNAAVERAPASARTVAAPAAPAVDTARLQETMLEKAKGGSAALTAHWKSLKADERAALSVDMAAIKNAKTVAAAADAVAATVENNDE